MLFHMHDRMRVASVVATLSRGQFEQFKLVPKDITAYRYNCAAAAERGLSMHLRWLPQRVELRTFPQRATLKRRQKLFRLTAAYIMRWSAKFLCMINHPESGSLHECARVGSYLLEYVPRSKPLA